MFISRLRSTLDLELAACGLKMRPLTAAPQISFTHGNAQDLPKHIEDNSIDLYTIAFGIRNCTSLPAVLSEAYRVLKPGGKIGVLEFGKVSNPLFRE